MSIVRARGEFTMHAKYNVTALMPLLAKWCPAPQLYELPEVCSQNILGGARAKGLAGMYQVCKTTMMVTGECAVLRGRHHLAFRCYVTVRYIDHSNPKLEFLLEK